jgi:chemotaxis protein histidine kinase CheA/CheY-like chemotaxis protein
MVPPDNSAEEQLQQELREMFLVDTQQQLETYFDTIQQLKPESWIGDIQSIYRAIHTIKGGAVTVAANSILDGAIALEDLLSDLRYLEVAPLSDGKLSQMLLESGELLASCLEISNPSNGIDVDAANRVQLTLQRIQTIHAQVKEQYLPEWNEMKQVHQEFAEQGFDLVILDLEMDLATMSTQGEVPARTIESARSTIAQLTQIGTDLELAPGWTVLIDRGTRLINNPELQLWRSIWMPYFAELKACVKNSGEICAAQIDRLDALEAAVQILADSVKKERSEVAKVDKIQFDLSEDLPDLLDDFFIDEEIITTSEIFSKSIDSLSEILVPISNSLTRSSDIEENLSDLLDDFFIDEEVVTTNKFSSASSGEIADRERSVTVMDAGDELPDLLDDFFIDEEILTTTELSTESIDTIAVEERSIPVIDAGEELPDLLDNFFIDEEILTTTELSTESIDTIAIEEREIPVIDTSDELPDLLDNFFVDEPLEIDNDFIELAEIAELAEAELIDIIETEMAATAEPIATVPTPDRPLSATPSSTTVGEVKRSVAIPIPLERLDRSAQQLVDTLLTARVVMSTSDRLQSQLIQLSGLTQESALFITKLRQLQDNYAQLHHLSDERDPANNLTLERYRQGYTTINRLLENILRMSELGQEIETLSYQNHHHLDTLDRSILRLKDGIETSRLIPFRNLTLRAKAILRDLTNRYGKPAELIVQNEQIELDAGIVQQLEPALLHLLRNAYDHGLESTAQRLAAGKPARGTIHLSLYRQGSTYRLEVEDDGRGIDAGEIDRIATAKGFALTRRGSIPTNSELLAILCQPGFSSSSTVSEVSGRGVGMDVVMTQIESIGGKLSLDTSVGRGTKFTIEVPAPQLLVPCVLFQVGERTMAFPTEDVLETALLSSLAVKMAADESMMCAWTLTTSKGEVTGFDLANYWQFTQRSLSDTAICLRTRQGADGREIWSIADDLLGQSELRIAPLPSPLIAPAGLLGVSLQSDGRLISILDPIALTARLASDASSQTTDRPDVISSLNPIDRSTPSAPVILVVDDAALMRRRFEASLHTHGFIVHTCNDGLEALNWLQTNPQPDLMITDVEMPNMDGFTLIDRTRQANIDMPILVVSSRVSAEWSKEARRLGANDYLNKGFSTSELIQQVNSLLGLVVN